MEDPGYPGARLVLEAAGAKVIGVPVDRGGIDVAAGRTLNSAATVKFVAASENTMAKDRGLGCAGIATNVAVNSHMRLMGNIVS